MLQELKLRAEDAIRETEKALKLKSQNFENDKEKWILNNEDLLNPIFYEIKEASKRGESYLFLNLNRSLSNSNEYSFLISSMRDLGYKIYDDNKDDKSHIAISWYL